MIVEVKTIDEVTFDELYGRSGVNKHFGNTTRGITMYESKNCILLSKFGRRKNIALKTIAKG